MSGKIIYLVFAVALLASALGPEVAAAQGVGEEWPPIAVEMKGSREGDVITYTFFLENRSKWLLEDVNIRAIIPPGTSFTDVQTPAIVSAVFDGVNVAFNMLRFPSKTRLGPFTYKVKVKEEKAEGYASYLWLAWIGEMPGEMVSQAVTVGPAPEATPVPTEIAPTPPATLAPPPAVKRTISYSRIVDLSHVLSPEMPIWPGDPRMEIKNIAKVDPDGYYLNVFTIGEHSGTHVGAGAHFNAGEPTIDQLTPEDLVRPAVVINVVEKVKANADYQLSKEDVLAWEATYGQIPSGSVVLLYTGWAERWGDEKAYQNMDENGVMHFPGFGAEATAFLLDERGVVGLGIDTLGVDPGTDETFAANTMLLKGRRFHLENLTNLDKIPPIGATLAIAPLSIEAGSGSPGRIFAFVP